MKASTACLCGGAHVVIFTVIVSPTYSCDTTSSTISCDGKGLTTVPPIMNKGVRIVLYMGCCIILGMCSRLSQAQLTCKGASLGFISWCSDAGVRSPFDAVLPEGTISCSSSSGFKYARFTKKDLAACGNAVGSLKTIHGYNGPPLRCSTAPSFERPLLHTSSPGECTSAIKHLNALFKGCYLISGTSRLTAGGCGSQTATSSGISFTVPRGKAGDWVIPSVNMEYAANLRGQNNGYTLWYDLKLDSSSIQGKKRLGTSGGGHCCCNSCYCPGNTANSKQGPIMLSSLNEGNHSISYTLSKTGGGWGCDGGTTCEHIYLTVRDTEICAPKTTTTTGTSSSVTTVSSSTTLTSSTKTETTSSQTSSSTSSTSATATSSSTTSSSSTYSTTSTITTMTISSTTKTTTKTTITETTTMTKSSTTSTTITSVSSITKGDTTVGDDICNAIKCSLHCEDTCGWDRVANICRTGFSTSDQEREDRLGSCEDLSTAVPDSEKSQDDGSSGSMTGVIVAVVVLALLLVAVLVYVGYLRRKPETDDIPTFEAEEVRSHVNPMYEAPAAEEYRFDGSSGDAVPAAEEYRFDGSSAPAAEEYKNDVDPYSGYGFAGNVIDAEAEQYLEIHLD
eukprot:m.296893 g.296893  ORF g.296893 m.296893 type:complete len:621 (-) comp16394_c0_seq17:141-2003(-)